MAFDPQPDTWLANWSEDGVDITLPLATIPELTAAEADGVSGDIRKIIWAICHELYSVWSGKAAADRPAKMLMFKSSLVDDTDGSVQETYTFRFETEISGQEVEAE